MPNNITKDFEEYKQKKVDKFKKTNIFEPLSSDIIALKELEDGSFEKISGPIEIIQITDVITDKDRIKKLEEAVVGPQFNIAKNPNEIKIGSVIWLTALAQRPKSTSWSNSQPSYVTIQTRVVNIYSGLNKLKTIM